MVCSLSIRRCDEGYRKRSNKNMHAAKERRGQDEDVHQVCTANRIGRHHVINRSFRLLFPDFLAGTIVAPPLLPLLLDLRFFDSMRGDVAGGLRWQEYGDCFDHSILVTGE